MDSSLSLHHPIAAATKEIGRPAPSSPTASLSCNIRSARHRQPQQKLDRIQSMPTSTTPCNSTSRPFRKLHFTWWTTLLILLQILALYPQGAWTASISSSRHSLHALTNPQPKRQRSKLSPQSSPSPILSVRKVQSGGGGDGDDGRTISTTSRSTKSVAQPSSLSASYWRHGLRQAVASACAAACCKTLLQPIDALKTVQQYHATRLTLLQAFNVVVSRGSSSHTGTAAASATHWLYGVRHLYAGLGVTVIGAMPSVGIYFGVYSYCKQRFLGPSSSGNTGTTSHGPHSRRRRLLSIAAAAAIGNTVASVSRVPYEVAKQKLQMGLYDSTWSLLRDLITPSVVGVAISQSRLTKVRDLLFPKGGIWIQMIRDVPYAVVTLLVYESLQQYATTAQHRRQQQPTSMVSSATASSRPRRFSNAAVVAAPQSRTTPLSVSSSLSTPLRDALIGGVAGGIGSWVTNPMDVIKTRLQTESVDTYRGSVVACAQAVWASGGAAAFLRGSVPRLLHKVPANALFFLFYELFSRWLPP
jgi:Mitochondrial carrier protein